MNREVLFKIFTGVHAGTEVLLPEGEYVLGASEDCDIILIDSTLAARHCSLLIPPEGDLFIRPEDAALTLDGESVTGLFALAACHPVFAGLVCFAWVEKGQSWEGMHIPALPGCDNFIDANFLSDNETTEDGGQAEPPSGQATTDVHQDGAQKNSASSDVPARGGWRRGIPLTLILLFLGALSLWFHPGGFSHPDTRRLVEELAAAGFPALTVEVRNGMVVVSGLVREYEQVEAVRSVAATQPYQVQLVVRTVEQFVRMARSTLAAHALFPQVLVDSEGAALHGYVRDLLVERAAVSWLRTALPNLTPIRSVMVTQQDVAPVLVRALVKSDLAGKVTTSWQPGVIKLEGRLTEGEKQRLLAAMNEVRATLKSPVAFQIPGAGEDRHIYLGELPHQEDSKVTVLAPVQPGTVFEQGSVSMPEGAEESAQATFREPMTGRELDEQPLAPGGQRDAFRPFGDSATLRSIASMEGTAKGHEALPFITTSDGRLYFIGGILPTGYMLVGIYPDRLEFSKNDVISTYKIQGW